MKLIKFQNLTVVKLRFAKASDKTTKKLYKSKKIIRNKPRSSK